LRFAQNEVLSFAQHEAKSRKSIPYPKGTSWPKAASFLHARRALGENEASRGARNEELRCAQNEVLSFAQHEAKRRSPYHARRALHGRRPLHSFMPAGRFMQKALCRSKELFDGAVDGT